MAKEATSRSHYLGAISPAAIFSGALAGLVAGIILIIIGVTARMSPWFPPDVLTALFFGGNGASMNVAGVLTHLALSAFFGGLFGIYMSLHPTFLEILLSAILYSLAIWVTVTWLVLPHIDASLYFHLTLQPEWWLAYHLIFGAVLGLLAPLFSKWLQA